MSKSNGKSTPKVDLDDALLASLNQPRPEAAPAPVQKIVPVTQSVNAGTKLVTFHMERKMYATLQSVAALEDTSVKDLLGAATERMLSERGYVMQADGRWLK